MTKKNQPKKPRTQAQFMQELRDSGVLTARNEPVETSLRNEIRSLEDQNAKLLTQLIQQQTDHIHLLSIVKEGLWGRPATPREA